MPPCADPRAGAGQARRRAVNADARRARQGEGRRDHRRRRRGASPASTTRVPAGGVADRLGHADQHEHERGARQPRLRAMGGERGESRKVHPNDDVNKGQSSNDVFPTAMRVAAVAAVTSICCRRCRSCATRSTGKAQAFARHRQDRPHASAGRDAADARARRSPAGWRSSITASRTSRRAAAPVRAGARRHRRRHRAQRAPRVRDARRRRDGQADRRCRSSTAPNKFEALAAHDALVHAHGALKTLAASLMKIANDVRWLASGPRCGIGELRIPENEPGSSIMPGKVNPTQSRGDDHGVRAGDGQRRGGQHRRRVGQLRAQRLQAAHHPQLPAVGAPARRRLRQLQRQLRRRHRARPRRASASSCSAR